MSNANKLREACLEILKRPLTIKHSTSLYKPEWSNTLTYEEALDALLQAIEDELPKERDEGEPGSFNVGYNWAMDEVKSLLASARSSGEKE
jgi:hypothetical protein